MKTLLPIFLITAAAALLLPVAASADLLHWSFRAKVPLAKHRIYELNELGEPIAGKEQGGLRASAKMFGLFDVRGVDVCLESGQYSRRVGLTTRAKEQRLDFQVFECWGGTEIRIHFNRPIAPSDYAPAKLVQYLSGIFDIEGFGTEPLGAALQAEIDKAELNDRHAIFPGMEFEAPAEYQAPASYGGGAFMRSSELTKDRKHYLFSALVLSRPMTAEELSMGGLATAEQFRRNEIRLLPVKVGGQKNMKNVRMETGTVAEAPRLTVRYQTAIHFLRRDYVFDDERGQVHYVETESAKKYGRVADPAADKLIQAMRFRDLQAGSSLSKLVEPIEDSPVSPRGTAAPPAPGQPAGRTAQSYKPAVEIVSASVQPAEVSPGEELNLLIQYRVTGVPEGFAFEVREHRELLADGKGIAVIDETFSRVAGETTSSKRVRVPRAAAAGFYSFRAKVTLAGVDAEASSFFKVR